MRYKIIFISASFLLISVFITMSQCGAPAIEQKQHDKNLSKTTPLAFSDTASVVLTDTAVYHSSKKITQKKTAHIPLTIVITNLRSVTAPVVVGIYKAEYDFLSKESRLKEYTFIPQENTLTAHITEINYGEIAVVVYQDMNSNGEFDKNFLGLPKEGYCFSNNFRPMVKAPCFNDCKFNYDSIANSIVVNLIR